MKKDKGIICLCGNDGTGKSTLVKLIKELYPGYIPLERSATHLDADL
jgi:ABC-type sugar transport system ATPase subunit